jgi:hypothetical protein
LCVFGLLCVIWSEILLYVVVQSRYESLISESVVAQHEVDRQERDGLLTSSKLASSQVSAASQSSKNIAENALRTIELNWNAEPLLAALSASWSVWCRPSCIVIVVAFAVHFFVLAFCSWRRYSQCLMQAKIAKASIHILAQKDAMLERARRMQLDGDENPDNSQSDTLADGFRSRRQPISSDVSNQFSDSKIDEVRSKISSLMILSSPASSALHRKLAFRLIRALFEFLAMSLTLGVPLMYFNSTFFGSPFLSGSMLRGSWTATEISGDANLWYVISRFCFLRGGFFGS